MTNSFRLLSQVEVQKKDFASVASALAPAVNNGLTVGVE